MPGIPPMPPIPPPWPCSPAPGGGGGDFFEAMTSSIRRIMLATSAAESISWIFTRTGSTTFAFIMSSGSPLLTSTPIAFPPFFPWAARSLISTSIGSRPAFSPIARVDHVLRAATDQDGNRPGLLAARDERHVVRADLSLFDEVRMAQLLRRQVVEVRDDPRTGRLRELLHVALLHPANGVDAFLGQEVLGDVVDPFLTQDDVRAGGFDLLDHGPQGLLLFIEEHLELRRIADADLLVHLGLLDLEGAIDERDLRIADELRHPRVDAFLVEDDSIDERRVREVAAVFLLDQDVVNVRADLARDLFDDGLDRVDGDVGQEVRVRPDASTGHRGPRDRSESVLIGPLDGKGELSKEFDGLRVGHRASRGDVVEHRAFPFLALGPFLQDDDLLTAHHENSRGSIRGLLYEYYDGRPASWRRASAGGRIATG